MTRLAREAL